MKIDILGFGLVGATCGRIIPWRTDTWLMTMVGSFRRIGLWDPFQMAMKMAYFHVIRSPLKQVWESMILQVGSSRCEKLPPWSFKNLVKIGYPPGSPKFHQFKMDGNGFSQPKMMGRMEKVTKRLEKIWPFLVLTFEFLGCKMNGWEWVISKKTSYV